MGFFLIFVSLKNSVTQIQITGRGAILELGWSSEKNHETQSELQLTLNLLWSETVFEYFPKTSSLRT